ncbi:hypothetical protein, partial [Halorubrum sp. SS7]
YSAEEPGHRTWCHLYNDAVANDGDEVQRVDDAEAKQLIQEHEASDDLVTPQRPNFGGEYR